MSLNLKSYEQLGTCPYNPAHKVVSSRMPNHLKKCRLTANTEGFKECRFNFTHVFRKQEIGEHEKSCPDRLIFEMAITADRSKSSINDTKPINKPPHGQVNDEDDWDSLPPHPKVDPMKKCLQSDIILNQKGGTPSERKARREKEYERLMMIRGQVQPGDVSSSSAGTSQSLF